MWHFRNYVQNQQDKNFAKIFSEWFMRGWPFKMVSRRIFSSLSRVQTKFKKTGESNVKWKMRWCFVSEPLWGWRKCNPMDLLHHPAIALRGETVFRVPQLSSADRDHSRFQSTRYDVHSMQIHQNEQNSTWTSLKPSWTDLKPPIIFNCPNFTEPIP